MSNLNDFFRKPTSPALRDGAHTMCLTSVECPEVEANKTPYILMHFKDLNNKQTYTKYMFENDCNFFSRNIKEMLKIAETNIPLSDICDILMNDKVEIPVYIHTVAYTGLDGAQRISKNWYFVTDYTPPNANIAHLLTNTEK